MVLALVFSCLAGAGMAQNEEDVLRYSFQPLMGTPRSLGMGGAMGVLGGDLSSIHSNPAGLAFLRQNTYIAGLGFSHWATGSSYIGVGSTDSRSNLNIPNLGIAFTQVRMDRGKEVKSGIINYTIAFSLNRRNNFNQRVSFSAPNTSSSILDYFAESALGYDPSVLSQGGNIPGLAWNSYLINEDLNTAYPNDYVANLPDTITMLQQNTIETSGRQQDLSASFGMNISHRIYLGATVNMNRIRFQSESVWAEKNLDFFQDTRSMTYTNAYLTTGTGFSANIGAIVRISEYLRAGISYYTGVRYNLTDEYQYEMTSFNFNPGQTEEWKTNPAQISYSLKVPSRIEGGLAFILPKVGSLSMEVEKVDYRNGRLSSSEYSFNEENASVKENFRDAYNFRTGAEFLYGQFRYRAGYAFYGSPLKNDRGYNLNSNFYTAGIGYRQESGFYVDFTGVLRTNTSFYTPYTLQFTNRESYTAVNTSRQISLMVAVGASF